MQSISLTPVTDTAVPRRSHIDHQIGEEYSILAVAARPSWFQGCACHEVTIGRGTYVKALVINSQGEPPVGGTKVKRKRLGGTVSR